MVENTAEDSLLEFGRFGLMDDPHHLFATRLGLKLWRDEAGLKFVFVHQFLKTCQQSLYQIHLSVSFWLQQKRTAGDFFMHHEYATVAQREMQVS